MNIQIDKFRFTITCLCVTAMFSFSCKSKFATSDESGWKGMFYVKDKGMKEISIFFSFKDSNGIFNIPDLIPIPLDITNLKETNDSLFFVIHFRSGPAYVKSKYITPDSVSGIYLRDDGSTFPLYFSRSSKNLSIYNLPKPNKTDPFIFNLKNKSKCEIECQIRLERILKLPAIDKYIYTKTINIEDGTIPHSHPTLTIPCKDTTDIQLTSAFIHEQMHWFILSKNDLTKKTVIDLKLAFPNPKIQQPFGSGDSTSTYEHLIVCFYEFKALEEIYGNAKALEELNRLKSSIYQWVYAQVSDNGKLIEDILNRNELFITP